MPRETRAFIGFCDPLSTPRPLGPLLDIAATLSGKLGHLAIDSRTPTCALQHLPLPSSSGNRRQRWSCFEDVHWADEASLDLLRFLGRRVGATRGLVIATYRDDEVGPTHPLQLVLGDLATCNGRAPADPPSTLRRRRPHSGRGQRPGPRRAPSADRRQSRSSSPRSSPRARQEFLPPCAMRSLPAPLACPRPAEWPSTPRPSSAHRSSHGCWQP